MNTHIGNNPTRKVIYLIMEMLFIYILLLTALCIITRFLSLRYIWLAIPCLMILLTVIPYKVKQRPLPVIIGNKSQRYHSIKIVFYLCIIIIPLTFFGCWILRRLNMPLPLAPKELNFEKWISYSLYSLLYIAVGEEYFFRGYIQKNIDHILTPTHQTWLAIPLSAGAFCLAHLCVFTHINALWTFLPGLLFAWLYTRTHTLLTPILIHGLANSCYYLCVAYQR